ncbi:hypothetical protein MC885_005671 [Smutsia gigantea]|nr:hypothetical protein MC885_005671 [Smutsia gigantea]
MGFLGSLAPRFKHGLGPNYVPGLVTLWKAIQGSHPGSAPRERQAQRQIHKGEGRFLWFLGQDNPTENRRSEMCPDVPC